MSNALLLYTELFEINVLCISVNRFYFSHNKFNLSLVTLVYNTNLQKQKSF